MLGNVIFFATKTNEEDGKYHLEFRACEILKAFQKFGNT